MKKVFRYEIQVDGGPHDFEMWGRPLRVDIITPDAVEFWVEHYPDGKAEAGTYTLQVFGTGHPIPEQAEHLGTAPRKFGLVWHLYDVTDVKGTDHA